MATTTRVDSRGEESRPRRRGDAAKMHRSGVAAAAATVALLGPVVLLETAVFLVPLLFLIERSLTDWQPGAESPFIGLANYTELFADPEFWEVVRNQIVYLLGLPLWVVAPLVVAYLMREKTALTRLWSTIYFLPAVMSPAIVGLVFRSLLSTGGPVNGFLGSIGFDWLALPWLTDARLVKPLIILLVLWAGFGTGVLIFSSAFSAIPGDMFEAARLDGAGFWRQFWYVAVPSISSTVMLWTMFQVISIFLFMFSWIYVLTGGGPGLASTTLDFSIYQKFMRFGFFGLAAAESVLLILMIMVIALIGGAGRLVAGAGGKSGGSR